ncbi:F-box only 33 [Micractinium conductrix]|uniref:F-box only 33 n=1 Tax=Micractinium conductrix TaxID=554055 RepID=A0A2P6VB76_9CHLO|nr:F-box only 33 [Micractinium conductrix]|eukprot:PSC71347.1 F-box only 33 [Micractinium conductrix]
MEAQPALAIHDLPEPLVEHMLVLAGSKDGRAAAQVCRRWRDLVYAQAALWSGVHLSATWSCGGEEPAPPSQLDVQLRALGRVAPHVRCFRCDSYSYAGQGWPDHDRPTALQLHRFLEALHPGAAREVELCFLQDDAQLSGADVAALQRLQGLARLQLHCGSTARLQPGEVHALGGLAQLTEFDIDCGAAVDAHTRGHLVRSVLQLSRLQRLRLVSGDAGLSPEVAHLTRLAHLRHLTLEDQQVESTARFPRPADFPALESYEFSASGGPKPLISGCTLCVQTCSFSQPTYGRFDGLYLVEPRRLAMVQTALDALPPRRGGPLRTLTIVNGFFEATVQWEWQELAQLHSLSLIGCSGAVDAALAGLLTQAHELSLLALVAVPATTLPQGAYLKSLKIAVLQYVGWPQLPPTLAAATVLECLQVADKPEGLVLSPADVDMLLSLPSLAPGCLTVMADGTPSKLLDRLRAAGVVVTSLRS